ncbi:hypothetical protein [Flaviflagellibacter deserti]|uniref:DUF2946 domain-containing protein n=1 Tax=Flaviflagellibacter deserti TaxID=2267266 RepID=A0ABV9Z9A0_9HYPH
MAPLHLVLLRCILGWVLVLQPMALGARAAEAINSPFAMEICRGSAPGQTQIPANNRPGHDTCCLAGCTFGGGIVPIEVHASALSRPVLIEIARGVQLDAPSLRNAGLGPQSARAPPV